ncbi:hypothetical protein BpHYR1_049229 [Brachionus plicatilis]|uniref:Uncharacterized protein n=1 Tax=Brachionus plicatilis TaxID=10195 RepID=A0A3M7RX65_BRAPC|nr:hypothetical protein BpHYR1_049229 [Brachionus plicatilis]
MAENLDNFLKEILILDSLVKKLSSQLQILDKNISNKETEIEKINSKSSSTKAENTILNNSIIGLHVQLDLIDQSIEQLNKTFKASEQKRDDFLTKIDHIQNEISEQIKIFDSIYKKIGLRCESDFEKMCIDFKQNVLKSKLDLVNRLEAEIRKLESFKDFVSELNFLESELFQLSETETNLSKELGKLETKEKELTKELESLESSSGYAESDEETEHLRCELEKLETIENNELVMLNNKYRFLRNQFNERKYN